MFTELREVKEQLTFLAPRNQRILWISSSATEVSWSKVDTGPSFVSSTAQTDL